MPKDVIENVKTKPIGFAPILLNYFEKCEIIRTIDEAVPLDPRRKVLTHGQACIAMITGILFQVLQLYRICQFAKESTILTALLPGIEPNEYFDDRLADTLDALHKYGTGNLEAQITQAMIKEFNIKNNICHNDTTCVQMYGDHNRNQTDDSIKITYGYSKQYRNDLKQLVWSMSVSADSAFPLFQEVYNGNTADVDTYVQQWQNLIDLLGTNDFLFVGDSKVATKENMTHIHDHEGFFVSPLPMYASYKNRLHQALGDHPQEYLIPYKDQINRGFEIPLVIHHNDRDYTFRMIVLFDQSLFNRRSKTLHENIRKTQKDFEKLATGLNKQRLKSEAAIEKACQTILKKHSTADFFSYTIKNDPRVTYKNAQRGRPAKGKPIVKKEILQNHFSLTFQFDENALDEALSRAGYYPLVTNKPQGEFTIEDAMMAHKKQYKVEHTYRRSKTDLSIEPIYLQTPKRIEAYLFLFKIALQIIVLIERTARKNIKERDKGLDDFMPNQKDYRKPKTEYLLQKFESIVSGSMHLPDGREYGFVSELTSLQADILCLLEVPSKYFTYQYLFNSS